MANYLLIESRDPFENNEATHYCNMAADLAKEGNTVTLFLVQNGVMPARPSIKSQMLKDAHKAGVEILADDFSLNERGIDRKKLTEGVKAAALDKVIDCMADGYKVMWH